MAQYGCAMFRCFIKAVIWSYTLYVKSLHVTQIFSYHRLVYLTKKRKKKFCGKGSHVLTQPQLHHIDFPKDAHTFLMPFSATCEVMRPELR